MGTINAPLAVTGWKKKIFPPSSRHMGCTISQAVVCAHPCTWVRCRARWPRLAKRVRFFCYAPYNSATDAWSGLPSGSFDLAQNFESGCLVPSPVSSRVALRDRLRSVATMRRSRSYVRLYLDNGASPMLQV